MLIIGMADGSRFRVRDEERSGFFECISSKLSCFEISPSAEFLEGDRWMPLSKGAILFKDQICWLSESDFSRKRIPPKTIAPAYTMGSYPPAPSLSPHPPLEATRPEQW